MNNEIQTWNAESLATLPVKSGFRQRGMEMTRLETFTDAAFAFAVTLLVISVDDIPGSYDEFINALKQIPAFIGCFMQLMLFWWGHHVWSRRYGLEDGWSMMLSLALVATVLIYIYPLRVIIGSFLANATGGFLPAPFYLDISQVGTMFLVFGAGFTVLSVIMVALFGTALRLRRSLALNELELVDTRADVVGWGIVSLTGLLSTVLAFTLPGDLGAAAGFVYWSLLISLPLFNRWMRKWRRVVKNVS